jgi:uncharacterized membrane protein
MKFEPSFRRTAIEPADCLLQSYDVVTQDYWVFVGAGALVLLSSVVPFGILTGPLLVGAHMLFFDQGARRELRALRVLDGLQSFKEAVIASLIFAAVSLAVLLPLYLVFVAGAVLTASVAERAGANAAPFVPLTMVVVSFIVFCALLLVAVPFSFCFQLIADRKLSGLQAVKLSARAARAHLPGLTALWLLCGLLCLLGYALCLFPVVFVFPFALGAQHVAYRKVFGQPAAGRADPLRAAG